MMITPKEAFDISKQNKSAIELDIISAAENGELKVEVDYLKEADLIILKALGYEVSIRKTRGRMFNRTLTTIYWDHAK